MYCAVAGVEDAEVQPEPLLGSHLAESTAEPNGAGRADYCEPDPVIAQFLKHRACLAGAEVEKPAGEIGRIEQRALRAVRKARFDHAIDIVDSRHERSIRLSLDDPQPALFD
jgi:hypothetical protein